MKQKIVGFFHAIKRLALLSLCLLGLGLSLKLLGIHRQAQHLASATARMLELRLAIVEEQFEVSAKSLDSYKNPSPSASRALAGLLSASPLLEEVSWIRGNGQPSVFLVRTADGITERPASLSVRPDSLNAAHQKGQIAISALDYKPNAIPTFQMGYPLDGQEGGFVLARVNLWDFLKAPASVAEGLVGKSFEMEIKDQGGRLLAHKTSPDPWKKVLARFFSAKATVDSLGFEVTVTARRDAVLEMVRPSRIWWLCLALAVILVILL